MQRKSLRPKHSTVVAYLALFAALGGTGYAATALPRASVTSATIRDGSVKLADLAPSIRPGKASRVFRAAVTEVVNDPASGVVTIKVSGEKGDKGDAGAAVTGAAGSAGATGSTGATGVQGVEGQQGPGGAPGASGDIRAFGHFKADNTGFSQGVTATHPGLGIWCVNPGVSGISVLTATPDSFNSTAYVLAPGDPGSSCPATRFTVVVINNSGIDVGFWFVGS